MTVLATPTWEDQRLSMPGRTEPPNMMRDSGAVGELDAVGSVLHVRRPDMVIPAAPVVPGQQEYGVVPVPGFHDGVHRLPDSVHSVCHILGGVLVSWAFMPYVGKSRKGPGGNISRKRRGRHHIGRVRQLRVVADRVVVSVRVTAPIQARLVGKPGNGRHVPFEVLV